MRIKPIQNFLYKGILFINVILICKTFIFKTLDLILLKYSSTKKSQRKEMRRYYRYFCIAYWKQRIRVMAYEKNLIIL